MFNDGLNHSDFRKLTANDKIRILRLYIEVMQEKVAEARKQRDLALSRLKDQGGKLPWDPQAQEEEDWIYLGEKILADQSQKGVQ
ncbi:MAG: hypothetical protein ACKN9J_00675 [Holophagaceae bacterium]|jgi:hypothetical protein